MEFLSREKLFWGTIETLFDKWLYVLKHLANLQEHLRSLQERVFDRLFLVAEIAKFKPEEHQAYEESLKHYRDFQNVVNTSKEEGFVEGQELGFSKGVEHGIEQGIENGVKEKAREIAKSLKFKGVPIKEIAELTGLNLNDLEEL